MKIFISNASGTSAAFAKEIYKWLEQAPIGLTPWASFNKDDLTVGNDDYGRILESARNSDFCISVISSEDDTRNPWINFEAGIFFFRKDAPIFTVLCGEINHNKLKQRNHPLSNIYAVYPNNKDSLLNLISAINKNIAIGKKSEDVLKVFINSEATINLIKKYNKIFSKENIRMIDAKNGLVD